MKKENTAYWKHQKQQDEKIKKYKNTPEYKEKVKNYWNKLPSHTKWYKKSKVSHVVSNYKWLNRNKKNKAQQKKWRYKSYFRNFNKKMAKDSDYQDELSLIKKRKAQLVAQKGSAKHGN